jgi:hypothetical protein
MSSADAGEPAVASDVGLDLLLLTAQAGALNALDSVLDIRAGLDAVLAEHASGGVSRPPPAPAQLQI